jgi:hypothetical protein
MNYVNTELVTYDPEQVGTDLEELRLAIGDTETGIGQRRRQTKGRQAWQHARAMMTRPRRR